MMKILTQCPLNWLLAENQLKEERELKLNTDDPYKYVLTNPKGDTFTFNPQKGNGEELNDFLHGYFNLKP
jgi:hypothetical protein